VGNTGNSSEPHLHFQLMNRNSPLASDGIPYSFPSYKLAGKMGADIENPKVDRLAAPEARHGEIPMEDEVVDFEQ
jgi:murein DD-endopeptidase MepM/ murein hydrolase activator NlpD